MALALPVVLAIALGLALGGRLGALAELRLRAGWLFFGAIGLQVLAFPAGVLPWATDETVATVLWLASYALLGVAAALNARVPGVLVVALGMGMNLAAILANGGTMPVSPGAMQAAGDAYTTQANSTAMADPSLGWLVDRWAAPEWIPFANVYSIGDVVIAGGAVVIVLAAMGARWPGSHRPAHEAGG